MCCVLDGLALLAPFQQLVSVASPGGFTASLTDYDYFGSALTNVGDINADGVVDLAAGGTGSGSAVIGCVFVMFLRSDGTVLSHQQLTDGIGGFTGELTASDDFGCAVGPVGDVDGDIVSDLIVGASGHTGASGEEGAVYVIFLLSSGRAWSHQALSTSAGGFTGALAAGDRFGISCGSAGDVNQDGVGDAVVGADSSSAGGVVYVILLNADGTAASHQKLSSSQGALTAVFGDSDYFGRSSAAWSASSSALVIGAPGHANNTGAVYITFLQASGVVSSHQKITLSQGGLTATLVTDANFGLSVSVLTDMNHDGVDDMAVGAFDTTGSGYGAVFLLFLATDGSCILHRKIAESTNRFTGDVALTSFGIGVAGLGDLNSDGKADLAVGASAATYIFFTDQDWCVPTHVANSNHKSDFALQGVVGQYVDVVCDVGYEGDAIIMCQEDLLFEDMTCPGSLSFFIFFLF